jgi:DNA end-binding protein Ku
MRSIWKGSLVFGLVNVPVAVYSATEDHDIKFHQVHEKDGGRIRYQRTCEICGEVVAFADIAKSYEADDGRTAIITDDDLKSLPTSSEREIDLLSFVPSEQIDPVLYDSSYLLEPASKSAKAYVLLRETLAENDRVAIVHFALRQKTRLAALRVRGDLLVIQTLRWPDEMREASFKSLETAVSLSPAEKQMAALLVDSYADDFHPEQHQDDYREELQQMIDAKLEDREAFPEAPVADGEDAEVLDLLAALQRSVQRNGGKINAAPAQDAEPEAIEAPKKTRTRKAKSA